MAKSCVPSIPSSVVLILGLQTEPTDSISPARDAERKRKVKQLFGSLATQEGEWKALKRTKFKH